MKNKNYIKKSKFDKYIAILLQTIYIIGLLFTFKFINIDTYEDLRLLCNIGTVTFIFSIILYYYATKSLISPYLFFFSSFFIFQFGQYMLYGLNIKYEYFVINRYYIQTLKFSIIFSTFCLAIFNLGTIISLKSKNRWEKIDNKFSNSISILKFIRYMFIIFSLLAIPMIVVDGIIGWYGGYSQFLNSSRSFISEFIQMLYIPIALLNMCYEKDKNFIKIIRVTLIVYSTFSLLTGSRTEGIAIILCNVIYGVMIREELKIINTIKKNIKLIIICLVVLFLIPLFSNLRGLDNNSSDKLSLAINNSISDNPIIEAIGEMGYSISPLLMTVNILKDTEDFKLGESYISSLICLVPENLDFTGIVKKNLPKSLLDSWLMNQYYLDFGPGFSLMAEAYYNFGKYGSLIMCLIGMLVGTLIAYTDKYRPTNSFDIYVKLVMLYSLFTVPRRQSYNLFKSITYLILLIILLLYMYKVFFVKQYNKNTFV